MEKTKIKKYVVYFAGFFGGVLFFISVPIVVVYLFTLGSEKPVFVGIPPLITIVVIYGVAYFIALKKGKTVFKITYSSLIFSIIAILCFLIITNVPINKHGESYLDSRRIGDLKQLQLALDFYYDENNRYPSAEAGCQDTSTLEVLPPLGFIYKVPQERFISRGQPPYQYAVSADGSQYVLWAKFEDEEQSALSNKTQDLDGIILGCDCDDPNFCVGSLVPKWEEGEDKNNQGIDTAGWTVYQNEKYRFEIQYPSKFEIVQDDNGYVTIRDTKTPSQFDLYISPLRHREEQTLGEFIHNDSAYELGLDYAYLDEIVTTINSITTYKFEKIFGSSSEQHYFFLKNDREGIDISYVITYHVYDQTTGKSGNPPYPKNPNTDVYNQILSTFKFLEQE